MNDLDKREDFVRNKRLSIVSKMVLKGRILSQCYPSLGGQPPNPLRGFTTYSSINFALSYLTGHFKLRISIINGMRPSTSHNMP
jgi:hypothetical protein